MRNFFTGKQVLSGLFATAFVATASFSMFAADNTNLMAGWDGNGIGTTTDVPSDSDGHVLTLVWNGCRPLTKPPTITRTVIVIICR